MRPTRRDFLQHTGLLLTGASLGLSGLPPQRLFAASSAESASDQPATLVVLYLRGGMDSLGALIPYSDPYYARLRPTLGITQRAGSGQVGVLPINRHFGFHPAWAPLARLYRQGLVAPMLCCGSTHPTRSHFDAQDFMERAAPGIKSVTEGWLARYLEVSRTSVDGELRGVSLQATLPRSLRGRYPVIAVPGGDADRAMAAFERMYACDGLHEADRAMARGSGEDENSGLLSLTAGGRARIQPPTADQTRELIAGSGAETLRKLRRIQGILNQSPRQEVNYPATHLGRQFRSTAQLIHAKVGLEVIAFDNGGWDTHVQQGAAEGNFARRLSDVAGSIAAFCEDLGPRLSRTLVLVMSEFGRTVAENGTRGTDHGRGGLMLAIGGPVRGGRLHGRWTGLQPRALVDGRDLPVHPETDFRLIFAEALETLFGFDCEKHRFFPEFEARSRRLGYLRGLA